MGPESPKILIYIYIYIYIGLEAQIEDEDMFKNEHMVSQRPTVVGKRDSVNRNGSENFAKDEPFLD